MFQRLFGRNSKKEDAPFDPQKAIEAFIAELPSGTSQWGVSPDRESEHWRANPLEPSERTFAIAYFPHIGESMWVTLQPETPIETLEHLGQIEVMRLPREVDTYKPFGVVGYRYFDVLETETAAAATASPTIVLELGKKGDTDVINLYFGHGYNIPGIAFMKVHEFAGLEVSRMLNAQQKSP